MYNNFRDNRGGGSAGGFSNGGRKYGGFQDRPKHDAKCDGCGDMCQVPFIPNGSKPVYCRNCFKKDDQGMVSGPKRSFDRPSFGSDRAERPAYQSRPSAGLDLGKVEARLARIEEKLDALIEALTEGIDDEEEDDEEGAKEVVQDVNLI